MSNVEIKLFDVSNLIERKCKKQKKNRITREESSAKRMTKILIVLLTSFLILSSF